MCSASWRAFRIALNITVNTNWAEYRHVTDLGVILEAFNNTYGRDPDPAEISKFIECFVSLLTEAYSKSIDSFGETPGAAALLNRFQQHPDWRAAISSPNDRRSGRWSQRCRGSMGYLDWFLTPGYTRLGKIEVKFSRVFYSMLKHFFAFARNSGSGSEP